MEGLELALWAMTAAHHRWPTHPLLQQQPVPVVRVVEKPRELPPLEKEALRKALDRMADKLTGKVVYDPISGFWVPEVREEK